MAGNDFAHADAIADCVLTAFDALPAHRKPRLPSSGLKPGRREWVPLAGIVLENGQSTLTCAALATGMKCLPRDKIQALDGNVVHDSHAEILALRAFNRFLLDHEAPCGDASMELTMAQQDDQSPWTSTAEVDPDELFGRGYFGTLGVVRRKPARPDAPPTWSKSCSDKLALKQYTSVLSAVSSLLIHPENAYIHTLVMPQSQMVPEACDRAFGRNGRLSALQNTSSGHSTFRPFIVRPTTREFAFSRRIADASITSVVPSNISSLTYGPKQETLINGSLQGRKQGDPRGASAVSRRSMWALALKTAMLLAQPALVAALDTKSYADVKASNMLADREAAKQTVRSSSLQGWKRNVGDDEWSLGSPT
ncbi:adenosine-deaminase domain-containing protein [Aureobasidium sp. EXF-12298]|nr:adenosine-deaminase domain-containing protein [Aureobasidium sp. EXF-12298]